MPVTMTSLTPIKIGEKAPDFTLKDQAGNAVSLAVERLDS